MTLKDVSMKVPLQPESSTDAAYSEWYKSALEKLLNVVQDLSHVRLLDEVVTIVKDAARQLTNADGASFVLRDGGNCYYVDENAISPLWKGKRFPMNTCISGWVMTYAQSVTIEDIYKDIRIPQDAYRPTFVKSLAMVPIRKKSPIGAIGIYWATPRVPTKEELNILQALADTTSVALENTQLYTQLLSKVNALMESNYELSRFAWVASHDLQEPLRMVSLQIELLESRYGEMLDDRARGYIKMAKEGARRQQELIQSLLVHASVEKIDSFRCINLNEVLKEVLDNLYVSIKETKANLKIPELPELKGEHNLFVRLFQNLLSNALKFHQDGSAPYITLSFEERDREWQFCIEDNGIGIDQQYHQKIFGLFQKLHGQDAYAGSGIGLSTCKKIVELLGGKIWVESQPGLGSSFYFTLPKLEN